MYPARLCHNNKTLGLEEAISSNPGGVTYPLKEPPFHFAVNPHKAN
jgi:hypothetical protein